MRSDVSALFVRRDGPYPTLLADWWDQDRDARRYAGPNPVVAHPPCAAWGRLAELAGHEVGDDDGCFRSAVESLARFGGVLEHPAHSRAWERFGLPRPGRPGVWTELSWDRAEFSEFWAWSGWDFRIWVIEVLQSDHGHRAPKATWLLYVGITPPRDRCVPLAPSRRPAAQAELFGVQPTGRHLVEKMGHREREETPESFARLLIDLAADSVRGLAGHQAAVAALPAPKPRPRRRAIVRNHPAEGRWFTCRARAPRPLES